MSGILTGATDPVSESSPLDLITAALDGADGDVGIDGNSETKPVTTIAEDPTLESLSGDTTDAPDEGTKSDESKTDDITLEDVPDEFDTLDATLDETLADPAAEKKEEPKAEEKKEEAKVDDDLTAKGSKFEITRSKFGKLTKARDVLRDLSKDTDIQLVGLDGTINEEAGTYLKNVVGSAKAHKEFIEDISSEEGTASVADYLVSRQKNNPKQSAANRRLVVELMSRSPELDSEIRSYASEDAIVEFLRDAQDAAGSGADEESENFRNAIVWIKTHAKKRIGDIDQRIKDFQPPKRLTETELRAKAADERLAVLERKEQETNLIVIRNEVKSDMTGILKKVAASFVQSRAPRLHSSATLTKERESAIVEITEALAKTVNGDAKLLGELNTLVASAAKGNKDEVLKKIRSKYQNRVESEVLGPDIKAKLVSRIEAINGSRKQKVNGAAASVTPKAAGAATAKGSMTRRDNETQAAFTHRVFMEALGS